MTVANHKKRVATGTESVSISRQLHRAIFVALLAFLPMPSYGQTLIDGSRISDIITIARGFGSAALLSQTNGNPKIAGTINRMGYAIYFLNCDERRVCSQMNFYAGFLDVKPDDATLNTWNSTKRFGRAYADSVGDASIEMDINMAGGVSRDSMVSSFEIWRLVLRQYAEHVGFQ